MTFPDANADKNISFSKDKLQFQQEALNLSLDLMTKAAIQHDHGFAGAEIPMTASALSSIIYFGSELIKEANDTSTMRCLTGFQIDLPSGIAGDFVEKRIVSPKSPISTAHSDGLRSDVAALEFVKTQVTDLFLERVVYKSGYIRRRMVGLAYVNDDSPSQTTLKF